MRGCLGGASGLVDLVWQTSFEIYHKDPYTPIDPFPTEQSTNCVSRIYYYLSDTYVGSNAD